MCVCNSRGRFVKRVLTRWRARSKRTTNTRCPSPWLKTIYEKFASEVDVGLNVHGQDACREDN